MEKSSAESLLPIRKSVRTEKKKSRKISASTSPLSCQLNCVNYDLCQ